MKTRLVSSVLLIASFSGCASLVPPAVNPTVEVWNVQPTANTDIADVIVEEALALASSMLIDTSTETTNYTSGEASSGCFFWCFRARSAKPAPAASQGVVVQPVAYYPVYSEPVRPVTRASNAAQAPAIKPTPRPLHVAAPKPAAPKEHAPRHTTHTATAKPSTPKSDKKKDKR
jgi:hypothetical protein